MDFEKEIRDIRAAAFGAQTAVMALLAALIETHPDRKQLAAVLEQHDMAGLSFLTNQPVQEMAVDMYVVAMKRSKVWLTTVPPAPNPKA